MEKLLPQWGGDTATAWLDHPICGRQIGSKNSISVTPTKSTAYWTREKCKWPVDLMGGARHSVRRPTLTVDPRLHQTILDTEQLLKDDEPTSHVLLGDEIQLEHHEDGYPKLPTCLDRRAKPVLSKAA